MTIIEFTPAALTISWPDGLNHSFHPFWLRERSFNPTNKDPITGHRLEEVALMPLDITLSKVDLARSFRSALAFQLHHNLA